MASILKIEYKDHSIDTFYSDNPIMGYYLADNYFYFNFRLKKFQERIKIGYMQEDVPFQDKISYFNFFQKIKNKEEDIQYIYFYKQKHLNEFEKEKIFTDVKLVDTKEYKFVFGGMDYKENIIDGEQYFTGITFYFDENIEKDISNNEEKEWSL